MARPRNAIPSKNLFVAIPGEWGQRLDLFLYDPVEERIPFSAHQRFIVERIREFFQRQSLDLARHLPDFPEGSFIYGSKETIEKLKAALEEQ